MKKQLYTNLTAGLLLLIMVVLGFFSLKGDALTFDESAHLPAGYSYLTQKDMRLNPEHPPLIKDLAGLPLLFQNINFPKEHPAWQNDINGQWAFGHALMFETNNNPDKIMLVSRSAMLLILVLLGIYIFCWARERYGNKAALVALFLFSFSPTFLAHGRLVTTDVGAAFAFVFAIFYFLKFLKSPTKKNIVLAGFAFGIAQLIKFSLIILIPFFLGLLIIFWYVNRNKVKFWKYFRALILLFAIGFLLIWPVYQYHVWNYPPARQAADAAQILSNSPFQPLPQIVVWMAEKPILRPYAQYLLGLLMVFQREVGGNTTYFLGQVSAKAWLEYFPIIFGLKVPVALLCLILIALLRGFWAAFGGSVTNGKGATKTTKWLQEHFVEFSWILFVVFYWALSVFGNLNIGIRHILPTFPFIYLLVLWQIQKWRLQNPAEITGRTIILTMLLLWYGAVSLFTFPFYLAYFNELAAGPINGYKYAVDSNLDWGQDLKRLKLFMDNNNIDKIKLSYFGGDDPGLRLGNRYEPFDSRIPNQKGWLAISATLLQGGRGRPAKGFDQPTDYNMWLNNYEPVAQIGYSIFVYNIE